MSFSRPAISALLALSAVASIISLTGCSAMIVPSSVVSDSSAQPVSITGSVYGGRQPVADSTVTIWAAGNTGYGSRATALATTTSDANGNFSFGPNSGHTYTCPDASSTSATQLVYITASGGYPTTGIQNTSAAFMVALGDCLSNQTANRSMNIDEVTTVASMFALQQFFSPSSTGLGNFGTSPTNVLGLRNAMLTVANLVNIGNGAAWTSTTATNTIPGYTTAPVVTITPETAKINTLADILATCVNTAGATSSACSTLYNKVSSSAALDTLQAAYYLASNPTSVVNGTSNLAAIYGIAPAQVPFTPTLTAIPTDWTIGVTYGSTSSQTVTATPAYFITNPSYLNIDSLGNVWMTNVGSTGNGLAGNSVSEVSPTGTPLAQILTTPGQLSNPRGLVVDPNNNLYVGSYGTNGTGNQVTEYTANSNLVYQFPLRSTGPETLASDGSGNIYVANFGGSDGNGDLELISAGAANGTLGNQIATGVSVGANSAMAIDSYNHIWLSNYSSSATTQFICSATPCGMTVTTADGSIGPESISIDHGNNIWIGNHATSSMTGSVSELAATTTTTIVAASASPFTGAGVTNPISSAFDGLGNLWIANYAANGGTVSELSASGAPVSTSAAFNHNFNGAQTLVIDRSGNVWVGNSMAAASATTNTQGYFTEIIGAAAPIMTPYSSNLPTVAGNANTIGQRP
jgi:sugar lactone lactonase YvrE